MIYSFFFKLLKKSEKTLQQYRLFSPNHIYQADNFFFQKKLYYNLRKKTLLEVKKLITFNLDQQQYFERVISAIHFIKEETWSYFFI